MMQFDHVELCVPDRRAAADWYGRVLGFRIIEPFLHWERDPGGPLMITNDGGRTKIALFAGEAQGEHELCGFKRIAFRVGAADFVRFIDSSGAWRAAALSGDDVKDHDGAFSVYFEDPWGNHLEVTTYETPEL